ncbi:MAG TPA: PAS domain-containing protein [Roseiarcus sp.]|nr:PAS domain-containing protein [Roseiarcus sp.]
MPKRDVAFEVGIMGGEMKLTSSRELFAYWTALRGARSAPERSEIDPIAIRGVLADTFILQVDRGAGYPFRIAGARISALFQRELRGRPFMEIWQGATQAEIANMLALVSDEASAIVAGSSARATGFQALELELLLLPLRHRGATHSRILGLCSPAAAPSWLGLAPLQPMTLHSTRVLRRDDDGPALAATRGGGAPETRLEAVARLMRRGHLQAFSMTDGQS